MATYREKYGAKIAQGVQQQAAKAVQTVTTQPVKESAPKVAKNVVTGMGALATGLAMAAANPGGALKAGATALKQLSASTPKQTQSLGAAGSSPYSGMSDADLSAKAAANSQSWHTADAATRKQLEDANVAIRAELDRRQGTVSTRDPNGVWTTVPATPPAAATTPAAEPRQDQPKEEPTTANDPYATGKDDYGDVDYSVLVQSAMAAGAPASEIQRLLDLRVQKALSKGYSQYAYDDVYRTGQEYIKKLTQPEEKKAEDYDLSEYLRKQAAARTQEALAGLKSAYDKSSAGYDDAMAQLPQKYQSARNEAAAQSALAQMAFDQRAAASGLSSGAAAQAGLDRAAAYQGAIGRLDQSQAADAAQLDRDKASLTAQYQDAIAKARAEGEADLADALYQEAARLQAMDREDRDKVYERYVEELSRQDANRRYADSLAADALDREYRDQVYADSRADAELEREETARREAQAKELDSATLQAQQGRFEALGAYYGWDSDTVAYMEGQYQAAKYQAAMSEVSKQAQTQADNLIKMGILPDVQTLELAGYSTSYAQTLAGAYAAKLAGTKKGSGGGGSGGSGGGGGGMDYDGLFQAALASGTPKSFLAQKANYKMYGFTSSSGLWDDYQNWEKVHKIKDLPQAVSGLGQKLVESTVGALGDKLKGWEGSGKTTAAASGSSYPDLARGVQSFLENGLSKSDASFLYSEIDRALEEGRISQAQYNELGRRLGYA